MARQNESGLNTPASLTEQYAKRAMNAAAGTLTEAEASRLFLASMALNQTMRDVEHATFMWYRAIKSGDSSQWETDYAAQTYERLGQVKDQLQHIGKILNRKEQEAA